MAAEPFGGTERTCALLGALSGFLAVGLGAFGAHGLQGYFRRQVEEHLLDAARAEYLQGLWETAVRYHLCHALALLAAGWLYGRAPGAAAMAAGWLFLAGTALFSGSLYALSLTDARWLGAVTPCGGAAFLAGWLCLAWAAWRAPGA